MAERAYLSLPILSHRRHRFALLALLAWLVLTTLPLIVTPAAAQTSGSVLVVPITGTIDLGLAPYLSRILDRAADENAAAVLLDIDTPGGRLDAVLQMRDAILDSEVRTIAFVDRTAFSAGALIAIAAEEIYMTPAAVMGAATPVDGAGETASAKVVSAVRKTFKTTAEARGRDPEVAEAMVDPDLAIDDLVARGELLTLTTKEAETWGYTDGVVTNQTELLTLAGLEGVDVVNTSLSTAEQVVRFITGPVVASLLIIAALILIIGDLFVEGFGIAGVAGFGLLALFFWGHFLAGLTGWEDAVLVVLGLVLIGIELFVIPGFGIPGILGLAALLGGLFMAMLGRDIRTPAGIERAGYSVAVSALAVLAGVVLILALIPRSKRMNSLVLQSGVSGGGTVAAAPAGWLRWFGGGIHEQRAARATPVAAKVDTQPAIVTAPVAEPATAASSLTGAIGVALSDLRPSGMADIGGRRIDVVTEGDYIQAGEQIEVSVDEQYRRVVRRPGPNAAGPSSNARAGA